MEFGDGPKSISKNNIKSVNEAMGEKTYCVVLSKPFRFCITLW
jgi:hypothetical protein